MSSMPECRGCGDYVHHGPCLCDKCSVDKQAEIARIQAELSVETERNLNNVLCGGVQVQELEAELKERTQTLIDMTVVHEELQAQLEQANALLREWNDHGVVAMSWSDKDLEGRTFAFVHLSGQPVAPALEYRPSGNLMVKVGGKPYRCECGCNVFTKLVCEGLPDKFKCNGCSNIYSGQPVAPEPSGFNVKVVDDDGVILGCSKCEGLQPDGHNPGCSKSVGRVVPELIHDDPGEVYDREHDLQPALNWMKPVAQALEEKEEKESPLPCIAGHTHQWGELNHGVDGWDHPPDWQHCQVPNCPVWRWRSHNDFSCEYYWHYEKDTEEEK